MFAYCNNSPILGLDPYGSFNLLGFLGGIATTVIGVAISVTAVCCGSPALFEVGCAVASTGIIATGAAALDGVMVMDATVSYGNNRQGLSTVIDFGNDTVETYYHAGATSDPFPSASYSTGIVFNYEKPGDYSGHFIEGSFSVPGGAGISGCMDPTKPIGGAKAVCASFSTSPMPSAYSYDYYIPLKCYKTGKQQKTKSPMNRRHRALAVA